jgi:chorismate lyase
MTDHDWTQAILGSGPWRTWLTDHGSLTRRLRQRHSDFNVQQLHQAISRPNSDELNLTGRQPALIREVLLRAGNTPLVFAHTVIPVSGLRGPWQALAGLGNRSLGGALFANPLVERYPLAYRRLDYRHPLYRASLPWLSHPVATLWARRSQFALAGHRLMVTEVFLPDLLNL